MTAERPPLAEVWKNLRISWYRCPLDRERLKVHLERSNLHGFFQAGGHLLLWLCTGTATFLAWDAGRWGYMLVFLFLHGTVGTFTRGVACHELGHGTVFRTKPLNAFFLRLYAIISSWNFHDYAMSHTYHHRYTLWPVGDREVVLPRHPSLRILYLLQLFTINITGGPESTGIVPTVRKTMKSCFGVYEDEWLFALFEDRPKEKALAVRWIRIVVTIHVVVAAVAIAAGLWIIPILFTCHIYIGNWLKYFVGTPMHCGLRDNVPDFRLCVRTITLDPISEFLYWHMNWHTEHHMFAAVPCYNLSKLHQDVRGDMPVPRTLVGAWKEMRACWLNQLDDPTYEFTTPLPPSAHPAVTEVGDPKESNVDADTASIGDLAPEGLSSFPPKA